MQEISEFHRKLELLIEKSGQSKAKLADNIGLSHATLSNMLNNKRTPSLSTLIKICKLFDVSADYLLSLSSDGERSFREVNDYYLAGDAELVLEQAIELARRRRSPADNRPAIEQVMRWWQAADADFEHEPSILNFCDVYDPEYAANSGEPLPVELGSKSLASQHMRVAKPCELTAVLNALGAERKRDIAASQVSAARKPLITVESIDVKANADAGRVRGTYLRLLLPARRQGCGVVLNFSFLVRSDQDLRIMNDFSC